MDEAYFLQIALTNNWKGVTKRLSKTALKYAVHTQIPT